jgi:two-component system phosphate regulon sensor histidine kinase PhoR
MTLITLLATIFAISMILFSELQKKFFNQLEEEAKIAKVVYQDDGDNGLKKIHMTDRITVINEKGVVLFDNQVKPETLDNHNTRPEVIKARKYGFGKSNRESRTLLRKNFYYAVLIDKGKILRLSSTESSFLNYYASLMLPAFIILIGITILSYFLSRKLAKRIIDPINAVDLKNPISDKIYPELQPFLNRLSKQNEKIQEQMTYLSQKDREFALITTNIKEGLIVL